MAHPIHPMLVHFPIACWSLASIGDVASLLFGMQAWWWTSGTLLAIGIVAALPAMVAGLIDLCKIDESSPAMRIANWHMYFVVMAWLLYATSLFMRVEGGGFIRPGGAAIGLSLLGFLLLTVAGWLGGKLVYGCGVGVDKQ